MSVCVRGTLLNKQTTRVTSAHELVLPQAHHVSDWKQFELHLQSWKNLALFPARAAPRMLLAPTYYPEFLWIVRECSSCGHRNLVTAWRRVRASGRILQPRRALVPRLLCLRLAGLSPRCLPICVSPHLSFLTTPGQQVFLA